MGDPSPSSTAAFPGLTTHDADLALIPVPAAVLGQGRFAVVKKAIHRPSQMVQWPGISPPPVAARLQV